MSDQIPSFYRYVSSIGITAAGSGYTSVPAVSITGGGGSGAIAQVAIFNGTVQTVTIINSGSGYTSAPTVTVSGGGGSGAILTAIVSTAAGIPQYYNEKSSLNIKYTLPEFIREDYPQFVTFIEKYYEYMDQSNNPINLLLNKNYFDIDDANDTELNKWAKELAVEFPQVLQADRKHAYKNIKSIFESKGSERSIRAFFKLVYNEEIDIFYPSKNILRASDGVWVEEKTVRVTSANNYEVSNLSGVLVDLIYYETTGSITVARTIPVSVIRVLKIAYSDPQEYEIVVELPSYVTNIIGPGAQASATATITTGSISSIAVTNGGHSYNAAPNVVITDTGGGTGATATATVSGGQITAINVTSGGSGYSNASTVNISFDTTDIRTFFVLRDEPATTANAKAFLGRTLTSAVSSTYSGSDAGFSIGDVFTINEDGSNGEPFALPGYFAEVYNTASSNGAVIRVETVDTTNKPTKWVIVNSGSSYVNEISTIKIISKTGESLDVVLTTGYLHDNEGKYKDDRGKLSDVNRLQDNFKFQKYSYVVESSLPQRQWVTNYKKILHPAGMEVFGDLIISNNVNFSPFISVETDGVNLQIFKFEDLVAQTDSVTLVVQYNRTINETLNAASNLSVNLSTQMTTDSVTMEDGLAQQYVDGDYLPEGYTGSGVFKGIGKAFTDTTTTSEVFSAVLNP